MAGIREILTETAIIQGVLAVVIFVTIGLLALSDRPIPVQLWGAALTIIGYYFGSLGRVKAVSAGKQAIYELTRGGDG